MNLSKEQILAVCEEVGPALRNGAVQEIRQSDDHTLQLSIRKPGRTFWLELSAKPRFARMLVVSRRGVCLSPAPAFLARLRKEVEGARILSVEMPWDDRVALFRLVRQGTGYLLVAELTGQHANLFLTDSDGIILASLLPTSSHLRNLLVGQPYAPPVGAQRLDGVWDASDSEWNPDMELPLSADLERTYLELLGDAAFEGRQRQLAEQMRKALEKVRRRILNLERDLANLGDPLDLMRAGELLKAHLGQLRRGMKEIAVVDYYQDEAPIRTLPLKPELDPKGNLNWYFERYKKSQRGQQTVRLRLSESQREEALLKSWQVQLEQCSGVTGLEELELQWRIR